MHFDTFGSPGHPALVCVPGLLGGPEDFRAMLPAWSSRFLVIVPDPNHERRAAGLSTQLTAEAVREISYDSTAADIAQALDSHGKPDAFLVGVSLGGKVVYDFAARFPSRFRGGLVTDVGPGPFEKSDLYRFVDSVVATLPLELPWDAMKRELRERIPDRNFRTLIQSQLHYPGLAPPAAWKTGMRNFRKMLQGQGIDDQFATFEAVDGRLADEGRHVDVLVAASCSGIDPAMLARMRALRSVRLHPVGKASHFLHVSHKDLIQDQVLKTAGR